MKKFWRVFLVFASVMVMVGGTFAVATSTPVEAAKYSKSDAKVYGRRIVYNYLKKKGGEYKPKKLKSVVVKKAKRKTYKVNGKKRKGFQLQGYVKTKQGKVQMFATIWLHGKKKHGKIALDYLMYGMESLINAINPD
ncbi:hypothetical protein [Lacticaseibacillus suilingensis]|uniref:hypothetical protein n=1 Tax=Lacticaseibacillus suilingensis TaxID=2799577 RepID=UPI0022E41A60|nr:hypothetical protein [Lacticaseibacillus suilingensis]